MARVQVLRADARCGTWISNWFWDDKDIWRQEVWLVGVDRFVTLLYGIGEGAAYLAVPPSTLTSRAYGYEHHVHAVHEFFGRQR